ncbi:hypothetical protein [Micromonospora sp. KC606]|uniref:hypothetical protein n=1 Tax=Micromonospora sp. KC606 TaxID=2530379 RepID=UPI001404B0F5|nr:hypothetical protein [Micromonospora sp. KC606]
MAIVRQIIEIPALVETLRKNADRPSNPRQLSLIVGRRPEPGQAVARDYYSNVT